MTELRFAARRLAAAPGFFVTAIVTLALGIGATTLMFSAAHGLIVRPLPFPDADRLAWIMAKPAQAELEGVSSPEAQALATRVEALPHVAVINDMGLVRELDRRHDRWRGIRATRGLADTLGISLAAGTIPARIDPDAPKQILIAQERWQRDFGSDLSLIGRELAFADNKRFIVAGVLPRGLEFPFARAPHRGNGAGFVPGVQDFWVLESDDPASFPGGIAIARVRSGRSIEETRAQVDAVSNEAERRRLVVTPIREQVLGGLAPALPILQIFAVLVLLVACGNLATLLLARAAAQRNEVAIRVALGARPRTLARMFAAEACLIGAAGSGLGLLAAFGGQRLLVLLAPGHRALVERISLDWTTVGFAAAVASLTILVFGVLPGLARARAAVAETPASSARHTPGGLRFSFRALVIAQVSLSLALIAGAAALRDSFHRIMNVDAGYDMRGVIAADVLLFIPAKEALPVIDAFVTRLQAMPDIAAVGLVHSTPLTGKWTFKDAVEVLDGPRRGPTPPSSGGLIGYDYFSAMGVPLLAGRTFTKAEFTSSRQRVMIINDVAARTWFPGVEAVGARLRMNERIYQVIGVVKGTRDARLDTPAEPQWYQPAVLGSSQVIVRGTGDSGTTLEKVRLALLSSDPRLILEGIAPLETIASDSVVERRLAAQIVSAFAVIAVALAAIGLYGVVHFAVMRRRREFGIRLAIGARPADVLRMVLTQGISIAAIGVAVGTALALAGAGALQAVLFEARAAAPSTILGAAAVLIALAALASLRPAWRAASVDPSTTLRSE